MRKRGGKKAAIRVPKDAKSFQFRPRASSQVLVESAPSNFDSHTLPPSPFFTHRVQKWGRSSPLRCITRVQTARRAMCNHCAPNNFASPLGDVNGDGDGYVCLSRTRHLSAPGKASKPFPRISIRNGFTRPTADINVNSPPFTKRPSSEEILTENLCDLPFSFRGPATRRLPPAVPWRPTRVRR